MELIIDPLDIPPNLETKMFSSSTEGGLAELLCAFFGAQGASYFNVSYRNGESTYYSDKIDVGSPSKMREVLLTYTKFPGVVNPLNDVITMSPMPDDISPNDPYIKSGIEIRTDNAEGIVYKVSSINDVEMSEEHTLLTLKNNLARLHVYGFISALVPRPAKDFFKRQLDKYSDMFQAEARDRFFIEVYRIPQVNKEI